MKRSGNPFVDMGLCTLVSLADKNNIDELSLNDIHDVFQKYDISTLNSGTKSFTMIFGTNGPLYQNSYKPYNKELYRNFLFSLLEHMEEKSDKYVCEICGEQHGFDIDNIWRDVIKKFGFKPKERKYVGRDFFPLIGSIGNDAQALPAASRVVNICPKCLFAVNYIPLGTMLIKGRLICIESTSEILMIELIKEIVYENRQRISIGNKEIYGKKEGNVQIYVKLMDIFYRLQRAKKYENLPDSVAIYLWLFSNSGTGADCDIIDIPNKPLKYLWEVSRKSQDFRNEFLKLVGNEKGSRLFDSISYGEDYEGLYPKGKHKGVTPEFYEYFEIYIVGKSGKGLDFARKIALGMLKGKDKKEINKLQKSDIFKEEENRNLAKKIIYKLILDGEADYKDYLELFNRKNEYLNINSYEAYNTIMYYLYNYDAPKIKEEGRTMNLEIKSIHTDKKIKTFAKLFFEYYVIDSRGLKRGIERFKKDILDKYKDFDEIKLKEAFARMAEIYDCEELKLDYDGWLEFIVDSDGNRRIYELLFQLRLAFAELYREYNKKEEK